MCFLYFLFRSDDVSADEDVVFVPDKSFDQKGDVTLEKSYEEEEIKSAETSDSEGVVVSSGGARALAKSSVGPIFSHSAQKSSNLYFIISSDIQSGWVIDRLKIFQKLLSCNSFVLV